MFSYELYILIVFLFLVLFLLLYILWRRLGWNIGKLIYLNLVIVYVYLNRFNKIVGNLKFNIDRYFINSYSWLGKIGKLFVIRELISFGLKIL